MLKCPKCLTGSLFEAIDEDRGPYLHCFAGCGGDFWAEPTLDPKPQQTRGFVARTITSTCPGCGIEFKQKARGRRIYCGPVCRYKFGNYHHGKAG